MNTIDLSQRRTMTATQQAAHEAAKEIEAGRDFVLNGLTFALTQAFFRGCEFARMDAPKNDLRDVLLIAKDFIQGTHPEATGLLRSIDDALEKEGGKCSV